MILLIDNYDSFVYNLYQYASEYSNVIVKRNDAITIDEVIKLNPSHIIISPGPKRPEHAGISNKLIKHFYKETPILGICLGMQCVAEVFSAKIIKANIPVHGKTSEVHFIQSNIFKNITSPLRVTRYHSLIVDHSTLASDFRIIAKTTDDIIMGIEHSKCPLIGLQYHPESILSELGKKQIKNFISYYKKKN